MKTYTTHVCLCTQAHRVNVMVLIEPQWANLEVEFGCVCGVYMQV